MKRGSSRRRRSIRGGDMMSATSPVAAPTPAPASAPAPAGQTAKAWYKPWTWGGVTRRRKGRSRRTRRGRK